MVEDPDDERLTDVVDAVDSVVDAVDLIGMRIEPGTEIGGYVVDGELGHGGMGQVYSATHPLIAKRVAIKILRPDVSRSPIAVQRFIQEARAVNQIGHPNIIDIFAYGALPDGRAYHIMDLLIGESLRRRLKRNVLHPSEAASVIDDIASALNAAHDHGFVHRDLKPDNMFLVGQESGWPTVKLLDFGLAKLMPEHGVAAFTTKTGVMLGTPEYMSPEQARGIGVDYRTDIYALGIVMFEILAGRRPFPVLGDPLAVLLQHAEEPPMSLADLVSGLPDEMVQLVDAMLAKTPQARPSLAAVRTVIKRLRTTKLPSRSVAGAELAAYAPLSSTALEISASRVGAEARLPGESVAERRRRESSLPPHPAMTTPGVGIDAVRSASQPLPELLARVAASHGGAQGGSQPGSQPGTKKVDATTMGVGPPIPVRLAQVPAGSRNDIVPRAASTHGASRAASAHHDRAPYPASAQGTSQQAPYTAASHEVSQRFPYPGAPGEPSQQIPYPAASQAADQQSPVAKANPAARQRAGLVVAILLVLAAAIALTIAVMAP